MAVFSTSNARNVFGASLEGMQNPTCRSLVDNRLLTYPSDVLRRHEKTHSAQGEARGGGTNGVLSNQNIRASIACDECAKAKIRCDGQFPCAQCKRKALVCTLNRPHPAVKRRRGGTWLLSPNPNGGGSTMNRTILPATPRVSRSQLLYELPPTWIF
jgi:hypothetical protein